MPTSTGGNDLAKKQLLAQRKKAMQREKVIQQAEAILKDSGAGEGKKIKSHLKAIFSCPFSQSKSIIEGSESASKVTVKQITEAKINRGDYRYVIPAASILVVLTVIYYFAAKNLSVDWGKGPWEIVVLVIAAIVTVVSSMYEIRVKRVDEVIAEYKEAYPDAAAIMNRDPWVVANRSWAIIAKYVSIVTVFMAALLAIK